MIVTYRQYELILRQLRKLPNAITHRFWLRSDFEVFIKLPEDLTYGEAERLSRAIRSYVL